MELRPSRVLIPGISPENTPFEWLTDYGFFGYLTIIEDPDKRVTIDQIKKQIIRLTEQDLIHGCKFMPGESYDFQDVIWGDAFQVGEAGLLIVILLIRRM